MTWKARFYCGIGEWLRSQGVDCIEVLGVDEDPTGGVLVIITYKNRFEETKVFGHEGTLAGIINGIT